ncbi:hypothetical protein GBAR_LOCUS29003 [Geodia barretti]|uniref:Uncharacterized protein n=1 Tax=Geodia barretti TaxID=519541 RepID=A0AA35TSM2_GEOBA|nr:hypothetical protein GBAR_LOCUS29003 [Geodia barretti]
MTDRPVLSLELAVRCCRNMNMKNCYREQNHCVGVAVDDSQTPATGSLPNCDTPSGTPSEPLSETTSEPLSETSSEPLSETSSVTSSVPLSETSSVTSSEPSSRTSSEPLSETPSGTVGGTEKEGESSASTSSTVTIVASVFGCLIVLILAALLALQLIRIFRKRKYHQHTISGRTENSDTTAQNTYAQGPPLPGEPAPYEPAVVNGSGAKDLPLHQQQPSPYETATVTNGVYSLLEPPDEIQSRGQPGGDRTDTTVDQHIYEDADRYVSSPECGIVNADYEVSLKSARDPNKSPLPATDGDDYADPDDALFDDEEYETRPKTIKYQPSDENDYSVPSDAIIEETDNQESHDGILNPLYHELGKNMNQVKPNNDPSITGVPKGKAATVESTMYEPAVSAPRPSTAHSDMEPITTSHVDIETTSSHQGTQDNTLSDREDSTPQSTVDQHKPTDPET